MTLKAFTSLKQCGSPMLQRAFCKPQRNMATTAAFEDQPPRSRSVSGGGLIPAFGPMWFVFGILGGMIGVAGMIGFHTAKQQLLHSPSVQVTKKKRQSIPEVDYPDAVIGSADKFTNKSFLRKVAHIQDNKHAQNDPTRRNPFNQSGDIETLKSVGVRH